MDNGVVAVIATEIAVHQELPKYGGGMGFLIGDEARSAKKLGIDAAFFVPFWRHGYYTQLIENRQMKAGYEARDYSGVLEKTDIRFAIPINSSQCWIEVWKLPEERCNTSPVYFLNADVEGNDYLTRLNNHALYAEGNNPERRIAVSQILGVGAFEAIKHLGITVKKFHLQESHSAFTAVELFLNNYRANEDDFEAALADTRSKVVFTTHTPVAAGNPVYDMNTVIKLCGYSARVDRSVIEKIGQDPKHPHLFNMAAACLYLSGKTNAVSREHCEVATKMWSGMDMASPIFPITNGVSQDFWQPVEYRQARTPQQLEKAKLGDIRSGIEYVAKHTEYRGGVHFSENVPTLVLARRVAEYKRHKLLFRNIEWLSGLLKTNKLQIVVAGKPHPDDGRMISAFNEILSISYELPNLVVLAGYEIEMSYFLKGLARIWLNIPRSPFEASGTSGMSAALRGAIHMSTPVGWAREMNPENCFIFGAAWPTDSDIDLESDRAKQFREWQDAYDAQELQKILPAALQLFEDRDAWNRKALAGMREVEKEFTSDRVMLETAEKLYAN